MTVWQAQVTLNDASRNLLVPVPLFHHLARGGLV